MLSKSFEVSCRIVLHTFWPGGVYVRYGARLDPASLPHPKIAYFFETEYFSELNLQKNEIWWHVYTFVR